MPMRLKLDDKGMAYVSDDGHPVFVMDDDGTDEQAIDVISLYNKVPQLTAEATKYRKERNALRDNLAIFGSDVDIAEYKEKADAAIETVQNFKDKELVEAGKVEQIKSAMKEAHNQELTEVKASYDTKILEMTEANTNKDNTIYGLMVSSKFSQSPLFTGTEQNPPKTLLPPEIAETYFGKHFKVEADDNGGLTVIGYDTAGNQLYSRKRPGELATFDEALEQIVQAYPNRDGIMRPSGPGSGAGGGNDQQTPTDEIGKLQVAYKTAMDANDGKAAIVLKNRIHDLQMKAKA